MQHGKREEWRGTFCQQYSVNLLSLVFIKNHKKMKRRLADLMEHKDSTATRFYHLHEKQGTCLEAGSNLSKIKTAHEKTPASVIKRSNLKEKKSAFVLEGRTGGSPKGTYG